MNVFTGRLTEINRREALYYLGCGATAVQPEEVQALFDECEALVLGAQDLKAVYSVYDINFGEKLDLGFTRTDSRDLAKYLCGCNKIALFAATAGAGIDRLIARYSRISPARAAAVQALGAALIEGWCDRVHERIIELHGGKKARFSCGFGDLPLSMQKDIFSALSVTRAIGVTLSDDYFMVPTKSVTAIVGIPV